jgi:streptomycin 6-kinase
MADEFEQLGENITNIYGDFGKKWLNGLPIIVTDLTKKYDLHHLEPVRNMRFNFIAKGYKDTQPIILKVGPNTLALEREADYLKVFQDKGVVKVLASENNAIIMEQAIPGITLKQYFPELEEMTVEVLCEIILNLHTVEIPKQHHFHSLENLLKILDQTLNIPLNVLNKARQLRDNLLLTPHKQVLLHGDLHHDNILKNDDSWLAIDPKGFIGDPAFEVTAFLCNPIPELIEQKTAKKIIEHRIKICAHLLRLSAQRICDWLYVKVVLCWAWSLEDSMNASYFICLEKIIADL